MGEKKGLEQKETGRGQQPGGDPGSAGMWSCSGIDSSCSVVEMRCKYRRTRGHGGCCTDGTSTLRKLGNS